MRKTLALATMLLLSFWAAAAKAEITVGINLSASGGAADIGAPAKQAVLIWPRKLGDEIAHYVLLDDASDPAIAAKNVRQLVEEQQVDVIVGPNINTSTAAALDIAPPAEVPVLTLAGSAKTLAQAGDAQRKWVFKLTPDEALMADALAKHMRNNGVNTVAYLGLTTAYGENWRSHLAAAAERHGLRVVGDERYQPTDTKVNGQVVRILALAPDAILIGGFGSHAAMPHKALRKSNYPGSIYHTDGIAVPDFLQVEESALLDGAYFPAAPVTVARELPEDHPVRQAAVEFVDRYEARYGAGTATASAGDAWGAWVLLNDAVRRAKNTGEKPGTPAFRTALRNALENTSELTVPNGVLNITADNHQGFDERARVMAVIRDGRFSYAGQP